MSVNNDFEKLWKLLVDKHKESVMTGPTKEACRKIHEKEIDDYSKVVIKLNKRVDSLNNRLAKDGCPCQELQGFEERVIELEDESNKAKQETLRKVKEKMDYLRVKLGLEYRDAWLRLLFELEKLMDSDNGKITGTSSRNIPLRRK